MLYAVSEIVFFLLLATLLGVGVGWWMARSDRVSVVAAMDRSGAHAAADRELASARAEISQLTGKLAVATEAIRELEKEGGTAASTAEDTETTNELDPIEVFPEVPAGPAELQADTSEAITEEEASEAVADEDAGAGAPAGDQDPGLDEPELETEVEPSDTIDEEDPGSDEDDPGSDENILRTSKDRGGKRLSARVAEASVFSRRERSAPKIKFDSEDA